MARLVYYVAFLEYFLHILRIKAVYTTIESIMQVGAQIAVFVLTGPPEFNLK